MNQAAEKLGRYGVQERARVYSQPNSSKKITHEWDGDDAIMLRKKNVQKSPARAEADAVAKTVPRSPYRVRDTVRAAGQKRNAESIPQYHTAPQKTKTFDHVTRAGTRHRPDSTHNTDEIFSEGRTSDEKLEAYRIARSGKRKQNARRAAAVILVTLLFSLCALLMVYELLYVIEEVRVDGVTRYTVEQLKDASGVHSGENLYSFAASEAEARVTMHYPYVASLEVDRVAPSTVILTVTEDTAVFCADLYGTVYALSSNLRVLEPIDSSEASSEKLIRLYLPRVEHAVAGRTIDFSDKTCLMPIRELLQQVCSSQLKGRITAVDCRNIFSLRMICDDQFLLEFGETDSLEVKLRIAGAVLADDLFRTSVKAKVDLTSTGSTSVVLDDQLRLDF